MNVSFTEASASLRRAVSDAARGLVERESPVELVALAAVAQEHVLVIGPPGTAKSEAVRRVARATGGLSFEYPLGRFTEPSEIFGPVGGAGVKIDREQEAEKCHGFWPRGGYYQQK
jgi:MoxR-like ATPase